MRWKGEAVKTKGIRIECGGCLYSGEAKQGKGRECKEEQGEPEEAEQPERTRQVCQPQAGQFGGGHRSEQLKLNEAEAR